tara:strand:+ start:245 stop:721 length:477 start_codon:yes stop_codon:yes gene_type:complete
MLKIYKKKELDLYRFTIDNILKTYKIKNNLIEKKFYLFLYNDEFNKFNSWFKICSAKNNFEENINNLKNIIDIFNRSKDLVSWKTLFSIDINWYEYFKQNADINGNILKNEQRLGVDKNYVNDIITIQNKISIFNKNLDDCIDFYQKIKFILFLHINK